MKQLLVSIFTSKKFIAMLAGLILAAAAKIGLNLDEAALVTLLSPILAYIIGQGIADHGKERAKVENAPKMLLAQSILDQAKKEEKI